MNAKELLIEIGKLRNSINRLDDLINFYKSKAGSIGGQDLTKEYVQTTRNNDAPFVKWIYKRIECEEKQKELKKEFNKKLEVLNKYLDVIGIDDYKTLATLRYVEGLKWEEIMSLVHIGRSTIFRYNSDLLERLEKINLN